MDLTPGQRKLLFAVVVLVLAGLGWTLVVPALRPAASSPGGRPAATRPARTSSSAGRSAPASTPRPAVTRKASPGAAAVSPGAAAASPGAASPGGRSGPGQQADIYRWLPFTQTGLAAAAQVAVRFTAAYSTFSYRQDAAAWLATMHGLIAAPLGLELSAGYATPGVAAVRTSRRQVSAGTAVITSLRNFGTTSITFVVTGTQHLTSRDGRSQTVTSYAVTAVRSAGSWQVSGLELASAGNS